MYCLGPCTCSDVCSVRRRTASCADVLTAHISSLECRTNGNINIANKFSENVTSFEYLRTTLTNKNGTRGEINLANAGQHSMKNLVFPFSMQQCRV